MCQFAVPFCFRGDDFTELVDPFHGMLHCQHGRIGLGRAPQKFIPEFLIAYQQSVQFGNLGFKTKNIIQAVDRMPESDIQVIQYQLPFSAVDVPGISQVYDRSFPVRANHV